MKKTFLTFGLLLLSLSVIAQKTITSAEIGLVGDGKTLNTTAIQATIDRLSQEGGGVLQLNRGTYLTGSILLRSDVELRLDKGAVLLGSPNPDDYVDLRELVEGKPMPKNVYSLALVVAYKGRNIKITGRGIINGQGRKVALAIDSLHLKGIKKDPNYFTRLHRPREIVRPNLLNFMECEQVELRGNHYEGSACWGLVFVKCRRLHIEGLDIRDRDYWNNDGIDIADCHQVVVRDCHVDAADDGICLKSDDVADTNKDILIENCRVESSASAIKFGTASVGGFQDIVIRNIKVKDTFRSAIAIESVDGSICKNILVENIDARNTGNAIFLRIGKRWGKRQAILENVTLRNITCEVPFERPDKGYDMRGPIEDTMLNPIPSSITGTPDMKVKNVVLENITLICPGQASKGVRYIPLWNIASIPEKIDSYPEYDMFGELPAYGFYLRHVDGIAFRNVRFKLNGEEFRPAFVLDDAKNVTFERITYPKGHDKNQVYWKKD
ncbi:MAG: glycoside hydrolase family 28 protein [Prevotella sp.]